ncbi:MAG TPA: chemotaxis protein CheX [Bryobacteraceae bacterium]|nr:chemotaxis protein CheX [Bryobacteraceae bacterium]
MPHELEPVTDAGQEAASQDADFTATLSRVAAEVLETMFFTEAAAVECEHGWFSDAVAVRVDFDGSHFGEMWLALTPAGIPSIASAFLGLEPEETGEEQCGQVILELANILCGAVLSSLWPESRLLLDAPKLTAWECPDGDVWHCCLALDEGMLAISIRLSGVKELA